jgi:fibrillarin-like rRNA methylase
MALKNTGNDYRAWIHFHDEVPAFASGRRLITIREGEKYAYLSDAMGRTARITLDLLDTLKPNEA